MTIKLTRSDVVRLYEVIRLVLRAPAFSFSLMNQLHLLSACLKALIGAMEATARPIGALEQYVAEHTKLQLAHAQRDRSGRAMKRPDGHYIIREGEMPKLTEAIASLIAKYADQGHDINDLYTSHLSMCNEFMAEMIDVEVAPMTPEQMAAIEGLCQSGRLSLTGEDVVLLQAMVPQHEPAPAAKWDNCDGH